MRSITQFFRRGLNDYVDIVDLTGEVDDPIYGYYLSGGRSFLMEASVGDCISWLGFGLNEHINPFVRTACELSRNIKMDYKNSALQQYLAHFQPKTPFEALGILTDADGSRDYPAYSLVYPWQNRDFASRLKAKRNIAIGENRRRGITAEIDSGIGAFGPTSDLKVQAEFNAIRNLIISINSNGYRRSSKKDGDIKAHVAIDRSGKWKFFLQSGFHRSAALFALGYKKILVRVPPAGFIRLNDLFFWPGVKSGVFAARHAEYLFNRMFEGQPPDGAVPPHWTQEH